MTLWVAAAVALVAIFLGFEFVDDDGASSLRTRVVRFRIGYDHARPLRLAAADLIGLGDALAQALSLRNPQGSKKKVLHGSAG